MSKRGRREGRRKGGVRVEQKGVWASETKRDLLGENKESKGGRRVGWVELVVVEQKWVCVTD